MTNPLGSIVHVKAVVLRVVVGEAGCIKAREVLGEERRGRGCGEGRNRSVANSSRKAAATERMLT